jgi:hypothetical protein
VQNRDGHSQEAPVPSIEEVEARMRPGVFSQGGFLGPDEVLRDVIAGDEEVIRALGVTCEWIGERLEELISLTLEPGKNRATSQDFKVLLERFKGFQMCPWSRAPHSHQCTAGGGARFASIDWEIINKRNKIRVRGPGLATHLIRDHHFFEGLDSPYRLDPKELVRLLGSREVKDQ